MDFLIKGNSGYSVKKIGNYVKKSSKNTDQRLIESIKKQYNFKSNFISTPKIVSVDYKKTSFLMEYINNIPFFDFFLSATKNDIDNFLNNLQNYFNESITGINEIPKRVFENKLKQINQDKYLFILDSISGIEMYTGKCHGDLTLSNILISDKIYFIDFLDSFIESPTIDIVKLRQDTHLYWFVNKIDNHKFDKAKLNIILKYMDDFLKNTFNVNNYNILQIINLLRIYPYSVKNKKITKYLDNQIKTLCEIL